MSSTHLSLDDLARVLDGERDSSTEAMRAHLRSCGQCAAALEAEANLDEDVSTLASEVSFCPGCDRASATAEPAGDSRRGARGAPGARCDWCGVAFAPGGFVVEKVLAESDHGRLYLAKTSDGELVALKELVFARVPDVEALDRFEREARLLKQLQHPRIPRYLASFREGDGVHLRLYLAQRYVDGPALDDEMETKRFSEADARAIAKEVLSILADLQALSPPVLHRDVKPANLVRDNDGKLSLVDFGSARDVQKTTGGTLVGTFGYMPVEQLSGIVDESTDVYALGATLVHLLTRRPPWESRSTSSGGSIAMPSFQITPSFRRFLAKCLASRDKRFHNAKDALDAVIALDTVAVPRVAVGILAVLALSSVGAAAAVGVQVLERLAVTTKAPADVTLKIAPPTPPIPPTPNMPPVPEPLSKDATRANALVHLMWTPVPCPVDHDVAVVVAISMAPDGHVEPAYAKSDDPVATACIVQEVLTWTLPRFDGPNEAAQLTMHAVPAPESADDAVDDAKDALARAETMAKAAALAKAKERAEQKALSADDEATAIGGLLRVRCDLPCTVSVDDTIPRAAPTEISVAAGTHKLDAYGVGTDAHITQDFEVRAGATTRVDLNLGPKHHFSGKKVTVDLQDADLTNFIRLIADVAGKNVALNDEEFRGKKVTMKFKNTPWDEALDAVARVHNLDVAIGPTMITVKLRAKP